MPIEKADQKAVFFHRAARRLPYYSDVNYPLMYAQVAINIAMAWQLI